LKNENHLVGLGMVFSHEDVKGMKVLVRTEKYAIARVRNPLRGCFAVVDDGKETSIVINQSRISEADALAIERDWRIITFDAVLPFDLVGFLASVSNALAEVGVAVFVISAYSTDHLLIKELDLDKALAKLREVGFEVVLE
jgi:hypothetical protein